MEKIWNLFFWQISKNQPHPPNPFIKGRILTVLLLYIQEIKKILHQWKKKAKTKTKAKTPKQTKEKLLYDFACHLKGISKGIVDHWLLASNAESILHI